MTSLNDRKGAEPAAAPLRAKIAQFESKGGVPVPRGKFDSFGSAAPPPQQNKQRRELYGNRMKPVWVPGAKVGESALDRTRDERREARRARVVEEDGLDNHLPSPPESPPGESDIGSGSSSPVSTMHQQQLSVPEREQDAEEVVLPVKPAHEYVYEMPAIRGEDSDGEPMDEEDLVEDPVTFPLPSVDNSPPAVPSKTESELSSASMPQRSSSPPLPPSPPLSPTDPPLPEPDEHPSRVELHGTISPRNSSSPSSPSSPRTETSSQNPPGPSRVPLHVDTGGNGYGTVSIHAPPRTSSAPSTPASPRVASTSTSPLEEQRQSQFSLTFSHTQGQTFSSVVHSRVHEAPARPTPAQNKHLPPPPSSPGYTNTNRMSNAELMALVANAAALERRLLAGDLPADVLKRLSMRPVKDPAPVQVPLSVVEEQVEGKGVTPEQHGEKRHYRFRNPLKHNPRSRSRSRKRDREQPQHKGDSAHEHEHEHAESTWFGDMSWRKLAGTSRRRSPLESTARTLISAP
ncbi:hypothetical protein B0H14DRAFT_1621090 [Mycena olivaceomarginata]|nr:hypothetical protein B0H14DRAFT_1621090 [Mycena olivaceomarginata]